MMKIGVEVRIRPSSGADTVVVSSVTPAELKTLSSRIVTYMEACSQRRLEEESRRRDREIAAERVCMECNGKGVVKSRAWVAERQVWARTKGTRPCPVCSVKYDKGEVE